MNLYLDIDGVLMDYNTHVQKDNEYLASTSPFYFSDMDFDGKDELVIANGYREPKADTYTMFTRFISMKQSKNPIPLSMIFSNILRNTYLTKRLS